MLLETTAENLHVTGMFWKAAPSARTMHFHAAVVEVEFDVAAKSMTMTIPQAQKFAESFCTRSTGDLLTPNTAADKLKFVYFRHRRTFSIFFSINQPKN